MDRDSWWLEQRTQPQRKREEGGKIGMEEEDERASLTCGSLVVTWMPC